MNVTATLIYMKNGSEMRVPLTDHVSWDRIWKYMGAAPLRVEPPTAEDKQVMSQYVKTES